eukprot:m.95303 g.95303  ORF g.95303 m.95303 type:complete len:607 (+) comp36841_c0_seq3:102-1922(+)
MAKVKRGKATRPPCEEKSSEFSSALLDLIDSSREKCLDLEGTLRKLDALEAAATTTSKPVVLSCSDMHALSNTLATAARNQLGVFQRRERQLRDDRQRAFRALERETSKQQMLVDEIELLAQEKHAITRQNSMVERKLEKMTQRRNEYAKKYRQSVARGIKEKEGKGDEPVATRGRQSWERVQTCKVTTRRTDPVGFDRCQSERAQSRSNEQKDYGVSFSGESASDISASSGAAPVASCVAAATEFSSEVAMVQALTEYQNFVKEVKETSMGSVWFANNVFGRECVSVDELDHRKARELFVELARSSCAAKKLDLGWTDLGEEDLASLGKYLGQNKSLEELSLHHCNIAAEEAAIMAAVLTKMQCLQILRLNWNDISELGTACLAPVIAKTYLTRVELGWNKIGYEATPALADMLTNCSSLQSVELSNNCLGPRGAVILADALKGNTSLLELGLRSNQIGGKGARAIFRALRSNGTLKRINLSYNGFGDGTASVLAGVLFENKTALTHIDLSGNEIESAGAKQVAMALEKNSSVAHINVSDNCIDDNGVSEISSLARKNNGIRSLIIGEQLSRKDVTSPNKGTKDIEFTFKFAEISLQELDNETVV